MFNWTKGRGGGYPARASDSSPRSNMARGVHDVQSLRTTRQTVISLYLLQS